MVAMFILLYGFKNFKGDYHIIHSWKRVLMMSMELQGKLGFMGTSGLWRTNVAISSLVLFYSSSKWEVYDGNGVSIKNWVFIVANELPHSWPVGS